MLRSCEFNVGNCSSPVEQKFFISLWYTHSPYSQYINIWNGPVCNNISCTGPTFNASPGHHQPSWYWLYRTNMSLPFRTKKFKYLCHLSLQKRAKIQVKLLTEYQWWQHFHKAQQEHDIQYYPCEMIWPTKKKQGFDDLLDPVSI